MVIDVCGEKAKAITKEHTYLRCLIKLFFPVPYIVFIRKVIDMLDFGTYIRIILDKKNLTQQDVVNKINQLGLMGNGATFTRQKFSNMLNGIIPLSKNYAQKLEKALELQNGSLNRFITSRR